MERKMQMGDRTRWKGRTSNIQLPTSNVHHRNKEGAKDSWRWTTQMKQKTLFEDEDKNEG
jgi:hypothetical protein